MKSEICFVILFVFPITNTDRRVFGGKQAHQGQLPHVVRLQTKHGSLCTGAIIHKEWVLSAAHCVFVSDNEVIKPEYLTITAGVTGSSSDDSKNIQIVKGKRIVFHEKYVQDSLAKYDISLINSNKTFQLNDFVKKIGFSTSVWPENGIWEECEAAGFGRTEEGTSKKLMSLSTIAKHGKGSCPCVEKHYLLRRIICLPPLPNEGICFGDSGGALLCQGEIVGVAHVVIDKRSCSFILSPENNIYCGSKYVYGVYMFTCPFLDWISNHVPDIPKKSTSCKGTVPSSLPKIAIIIISLNVLLNKT